MNRKKGLTEALVFMKQNSTFGKLPEKTLIQLLQSSKFAKVATGEYIAFQGDVDAASFIVISGRFSMTKSTPSGKELVVELLGPGDFFGLIFAIEGLPAQLAARAHRDSEILWIQTAALQEVLKENPELYKNFLEYFSHCLHSSHSLSQSLAHSSVKVRIVSLLLNLAEKFPRLGEEINSPIVVDITRQQIADLTGTTPETATRVTRAMHKEGVINCGTPGMIRIIDIEALKELTEEEEEED